MVFSAKGLLLNRKGAKDAKGDGCWSVLILEERPESELMGDVGSLVSLLRFYHKEAILLT
jgi:hypothetical protein